jgi:hypothetical protein
MLIFLAGEGSRFITGQLLAVDGGAMMVGAKRRGLSTTSPPPCQWPVRIGWPAKVRRGRSSWMTRVG